MIIARVLSPIVSTIKDPSFHAKKIFSVQPLNEKYEPVGSSYLAFDHVQAGEGDIVLICREGNGCRQMWQNDQAPVNAVISGIIDTLTVI
jgi:ethanolamine utilization protein EutN